MTSGVHVVTVLMIALLSTHGMAQALHSGNDDLQLLKQIEVVLRGEEDQFCSDTQARDCRKQFRNGIKYKVIELTPDSKRGLFVELSLHGFCGSGGCSIYVLRKKNGAYESVLQSIGGLKDLELLRTTTKGFYDLVQSGFYNGEQRNRRYVWTGSKYELKKTIRAPADGTSRN